MGIFLSIFFFIYVTGVERNEFKSQVNLVVDSFINDKELEKLGLQNLTDEQKKNLSIMISGIAESSKQKVLIDASDNIKANTKNNQKIINNLINIIIIVIIIIIIIALIFYILGFCIPFFHQIKHALYVIIFVALTEFIFLTVIAKNYISADPNKIKNKVSDSIYEWVDKNYPTPSPSPSA